MPDKTLEIYLNYACNQKCFMCFNPEFLKKEHKQLSFPALSRHIFRMRKRGYNTLSLLGGEPTLHPQLDKIISFGSKCGYTSVIIFTNGQKLSDPEFARKLKAAGLTLAVVSVHGHTARLHESVTRVKGSFSKAVQGLENLLSLGIPACLTIVINKKNYPHLPETIKFFTGMGIELYQLFFTKYQGRLLEEPENARKFLVSMTEASKTLKEVFTFFKVKKMIPPNISHIPPCIIPEYSSRIATYHPGKAVSDNMAMILQDANIYPGGKAYQGNIFTEHCKECAYFSGCSGINPEYSKIFGTGEFRPVLKMPQPFFKNWTKEDRKTAGTRLADHPASRPAPQAAPALVPAQDEVPEPNIFITEKCNRACIFCSAKGEQRLMTRAEMLTCLESGLKSVVFEGGEPLLSPDLEKWVRLAKKNGVEEVGVLTNGSLLDGPRLKRLLKAGVDHFQFNFPSHIEKLYNLLTGASGPLGPRINAMRSVIRTGGEAAVIVCVLNSVNYRTLPDYIDFSASRLKGLFYVALNFIKIKGLAKKRNWLVPRFSELRPYLNKALERARILGIPVLIDGVPLCFLNGFEAYSRDAGRILMGDSTYLKEKGFVKACFDCSLKPLCPGPRKDYVALHGALEFKSSSKSPGPIKKNILRGQLALNQPPLTR